MPRYSYIYSTLTLLLFVSLVSWGQDVSVTFQVDMSQEEVSPLGIHIAGNFQEVAGLGNDWNPGSVMMQDIGDGVYSLEAELPAGEYQYKFINGNSWGADESPIGPCSTGGTNNRFVLVGDSDLTIPVAVFNQCGPVTRLAVNMQGETISAEGVHVMGDFQMAIGYASDWDPSTVQLQDANADGIFEVELSLPNGTYEFLFVNGNTPEQSETLSTECATLGDNGTNNRVIELDGSDIDYPLYCFDSCTLCPLDPSTAYETDWWNDAVFYEVFLRSFYDSDGDGIGDFQGLREKLDYLNDGDPNTDTDLGVTGIWLMPMMDSPSYHGYDVRDYYATEPDYGSMEDFEAFLDEAHDRGIKVIIDLVLNHSSSIHPWFQQSAAGDDDYRDWYIWSEDNPGYNGPWGQPVWHWNSGSYFYGLFWSGMPDLNYEHPPVKQEMFDVVEFWLDKGVDGYRLDAVKYLIEEGTQLENTQGNFDLLEEFETVYNQYEDVYTVGEVWSNTSSIVPYVQPGRLDMCFEFDLANRIIGAVNSTNAIGLEEHMEFLKDVYPALQYGTFLTNHDIDRIATVLGGSQNRMRSAASIYMTLPGVPFIYYGEEVGMTGSGDHINIRRPMQWSNDTNAGFTDGNPWTSLGINYPGNNVVDFEADPNSLLNHYKKLIRIRNEQVALRRGGYRLLEGTDDGIYAFCRDYGDEAVLVMNNLSSQTIQEVFSLAASSLDPGEYSLTELYSETSFGSLSVNEDGGFEGWQGDATLLNGHETRIFLISEDSPLSTEEVREVAPSLALFPNPAMQQVRISGLDKQTIPLMRVYDVLGKLIHQERAIELDVSSWTNGQYIIEVIQDDSIVPLPFIKN